MYNVAALFRRVYCLPIPHAILLAAGGTGCFLLLRWRFGARRGWKGFCAAALGLWLVAVLWLTIFSRNPGAFPGEITLRPFDSYLRAFRFGESELLRSNFMNLLLFYPGGMLLSQLLPRRKGVLLAGSLLCLASAAIELTQYFAALGQLELDDVLHNTLGGVLGAILCRPRPEPQTPGLSAMQETFLTILKAGLNGRRADIAPPEEGEALLLLAAQHKLLPLTLSALPPAWPVPAGIKRSAFRQTAMQAQKTTAFLTLYRRLEEKGFHPLVVKGILCRELYPQGDLRPSNDEDLFIPDEEFAPCCRALIDLGFVPGGEWDDHTSEVGFRDGTLYIELHRHLFPPDSPAYRELNRFFPHPGASGQEYPPGVRSLSPEDHLLYLILHAYKHFLHSGFGIRQICDICLWAQTHADQISWRELRRQCESCGAARFAAALLGIGTHYLDISPALPEEWRLSREECLPLLADILSAGVYGTAGDDRLHSATVTLNAVAAHHSGSRRSILPTLFPPLSEMQRKYPRLKTHPILLPLAWLKRILSYLRQGGNASASAAIATDRVALLKYYGILK